MVFHRKIHRVFAMVILVSSVVTARHTPGSKLGQIPNHQKSSSRTLVLVPSTSEPSQVRSSVRPSIIRGGGVVDGGGLAHSLKVLFLFALWYALNVVYNITNKSVLNSLPLPSLVAVAQLGVGSLYALGAWASGLRKDDVAALGPSGGLRALLPIACAHGIGQVATVLSLGAGAVSFTHIVKALEPLFSAAVSAVVSGEILKPQVYATLLPVVGGVSLAVAKEISFSWWAFGTAMGSNLAFALRAVLSKIAMSGGHQAGGNGGARAAIASLSAPSLFGVVTCLSFVAMAPFALLAEGPTAASTWAKAASEGQRRSFDLAKSVALSGLFHYLNNEVMYLVLDNVHPVTLAVGNTLKRVVIIVASLVIFQNPMAPAAQVGSAIGIGGVLLYSLTKQHYDRMKSTKDPR